MTAVPRKVASAGTHSARWKTFLLPRRMRAPGRMPGLLLVLPALALVHVMSPSNATEAGLMVLAVVATSLLVGAGGVPRWLSTLNPLNRRGGANPSHLRIVGTQGWLPVADGMLEQAMADRRPLSIAVLELHDLPELHQLFGRAMANRIVIRVSRKLRVVAGGKGLAVRTSRTQFTLVLPGLEADAVRLALSTVFGEACCIEDDAGADEMVLLPRFEVATLSGTGECIRSGHQRLCEAVAAWQGEGRCASSTPRPEPTGPLPAPATEHHLARSVYVPTVPLPLR